MSKQSIIGASASLIAFILLLVLTSLPWPYDFAFPGTVLFEGGIQLSAVDLSKYLAVMQINYAVDEVFIISWIVSWWMICTRLPLSTALRILLLVIGLVGPLLDFAENAYVWQMISLLESAGATDPELLSHWQSIRHLSYVIPFSVCIVLSTILYTEEVIGEIILVLSIGITAVAVLGLYLPIMGIFSDLWWLYFFLFSADVNRKL